MSAVHRCQHSDEGYGSDNLSTSPVKRRLDSSIARDSVAFKNKYKVCGLLHNSANGLIYECQRKSDNTTCIAKQVVKAKVTQWIIDPRTSRRIPKEFYLQQLASSVQGVVQIFDFYERRSSWVLVMEKPANSTDLFEVSAEVGKLDVSTARTIWRHVCQTTINLHRAGVFHRDIKDENILVDVTSLKARIIDFGCSDWFDPNKKYERFAGTHEFAPPEVFTIGTHRAEPTTVWSLGTLLYTMLMGRIPFDSTEAIKAGQFSRSISSLPKSTQSAIKQCLQINPAKRPTIEELLAHPFLNNNNQD